MERERFSSRVAEDGPEGIVVGAHNLNGYMQSYITPLSVLMALMMDEINRKMFSTPITNKTENMSCRYPPPLLSIENTAS